MTSSKKLSLVGAAVAVALGSSAYALPPSAWTSTSNPITVYYAGGGSAEPQAVYVAVSKLLVPSSIDVYTDGTGSTKHPQSLSYLIVSGYLASSPTTPVGFMYKYSGGSFTNGVLPFISGQTSTLNYPTLASLAAASGAPAGYTGSNPTSVNPDLVFTPTLGNNQTPGWGISDEEPALFLNTWNGNNSGITTASGVLANPAYVNGFGIAVTAAVFAQKKIWSAGEIAAVYQGPQNGGITAWSQLLGDNGSPLTVAGPIAILDRGSGSGTKAGVNDYFFGYPVSTTHFSGNTSPNSVSGTQANNYTSSTYSTSATTWQDIKEGSSAAVVDDLVAANTAGLGAIAALGLEFPPAWEQNTAGTNAYDFVAINGVFPDTETGADYINNPAGGSTKYTNLVNGTYTFAYQTSVNWKTAPTGFQASVTAYLIGNENLSGAHTGSGFPTSADGVLLDPATTNASDAGNLNWTRSAQSTWTPLFYGTVSPANADPL